MKPTVGTLELLITAFDAPRDPATSSWGRQVPVLLYERLSALEGVRARLAIDGAPHPKAIRPSEVVLEGAVRAGEEVTLEVRLLRGLERAPLLVRGERFKVRELFKRLDELAADVARALGARRPSPVHAYATGFTTLRDYLRAMDLSEDPDLPLELEDRRRKLEWLLLAVEADPSFAPAQDALLEAGLMAHQSGLTREARRALELLSRLAPRDARASYVLGELALLYGSVDEAAAHFRRAIVRDPNHIGAAFRLGLLADDEGDREAAKGYFKTAGDAVRPSACTGGGPSRDAGETPELASLGVRALLLLGILCSEDGEREAAGRAFARAQELDPEGCAGMAAQFELAKSASRSGAAGAGGLSERSFEETALRALRASAVPVRKASGRRRRIG